LIQRHKSSYASTSPNHNSHIYEQALANAHQFDQENNLNHEKLVIPHCVRTLVTPIRPVVNESTDNGGLKFVPPHIARPPYARTGRVPESPHFVAINGKEQIDAIRKSAQLARNVLDLACSSAKVGMTTNDIDDIVHDAIIKAGAYPSPLNYAGFPKSVCSSINEVICHGIPDDRRMKKGDLASFDVSCYFDGFHGDNCGSIVIGDNDPNLSFSSREEELLFITGRRLIQATKEALDAAISTCRDGSCLTEVGDAISSVTDAYGYATVEKYRGHGVGRDFHCPPFVKQYRNTDYFTLKEGMVFTIEPMITEGRQDCCEWKEDGWTVVTKDGGRAAQFEHMVAITSDGAEILTLPTVL
jgi:methionyl aminopeptidase